MPALVLNATLYTDKNDLVHNSLLVNMWEQRGRSEEEVKST